MMQEMTPEEIKEKKPYLDWSLSEEEYDYICDKLLHRLPNYTAHTRSLSRFSVSSQPRVPAFCKGLVKGQGLLTSVTAKLSFSRLKATTTQLLLNLTKGQLLVSAGSCVTSSAWGPGQLLLWTLCTLVN